MLKTCKVCGKARDMMSWEDTCYTCCCQKHLDEVKHNILGGEETETSCEDEVICPWCGEVQEYDIEDYEIYEEGEHEMQCHDCEKYFKLGVSVFYYYGTERIGDDINGLDENCN